METELTWAQRALRGLTRLLGVSATVPRADAGHGMTSPPPRWPVGPRPALCKPANTPGEADCGPRQPPRSWESPGETQPEAQAPAGLPTWDAARRVLPLTRGASGGCVSDRDGHGRGGWNPQAGRAGVRRWVCGLLLRFLPPVRFPVSSWSAALCHSKGVPSGQPHPPRPVRWCLQCFSLFTVGSLRARPST